MKLSALDKAQLLKIAKVAGYVALSTLIGGVLALIASNPVVFGVATPFVNILLVTIKQLFTDPTL